MRGGELGHVAGLCPSGRVDSWGIGPFVLEVNDCLYRFEDSDRFGPYFVGRDGAVLVRQPGSRHPFWRAHTMWVAQGRRLGADGVTCIYDPPRPTVVERRGRRLFVVEDGDEWGEIVEVGPELSTTPGTNGVQGAAPPARRRY